MVIDSDVHGHTQSPKVSRQQRGIYPGPVWCLCQSSRRWWWRALPSSLQWLPAGDITNSRAAIRTYTAWRKWPTGACWYSVRKNAKPWTWKEHPAMIQVGAERELAEEGHKIHSSQQAAWASPVPWQQRHSTVCGVVSGGLKTEGSALKSALLRPYLGYCA